MDSGAEYYKRFLDGDENAIVDIIREYNDGLIMYLNGVMNDLNAAEDSAEDTFFKLLTRKPSFSGKSSFKTWLYAIGRNTAIDNLRKRAKHSYIYTSDMLYEEADENDLESNYLKKEQKITLHKAVRRLNSDYRQVLYLTVFEGFSNGEAAKIMNKSTRQIENLLYRAKKSLRTELEKEGFEYEII